LIQVARDTPRNVKMKIYRIMNGAVVTIKGRRYRSKGMVKDMKGIKISGSLYMFPLEYIPIVLEKLSEKKLDSFIKIIETCRCSCD